jgi:DNA (cytosine-5)-methyltransferase 1
MKIGSLFTGVGGFDLGAERAGYEVAWQVEINVHCRSILKKHFPNTSIYKDVCNVGGPRGVRGGHGGRKREREFHEEQNTSDGNVGRSHDRGNEETTSDILAPVDLICGGFPCQDLSVAGLRRGLAGERSGLWGEFHRILSECTPRFCLIENVPGLLSSNDGADMRVVLRGLEDLGYGWTYRVLNSEYFGVPQRRRRVFILGYFGNECPAEILLESESMPGRAPPSGETWQKITNRTQDGLGTSRRARTHWEGGSHPTLDCRGSGMPPNQSLQSGGTLVGDVTPLTIRNGGFSNYAEDDVGSTLRASNHEVKDLIVEQPAEQAHGLFKKTTRGKGFADWEDGEIITTLTGHDLGSESWMQEMVVPSDISVPRKLTPRECERLQGFPDDWTRYTDQGQEISDGHRYNQMGNAVTVPVAEWIFRRLLKHI